jgi:hypothetical protein
MVVNVVLNVFQLLSLDAYHEDPSGDGEPDGTG